MKKIHKTAELMWLLGIVFIALGVSICSKADLGVSMIAAPAFILSGALHSTFSWLSVGVTEYIVQGIMLVLMCLMIRRFKWQYLLAFLVGVFYGYTLDLFLWLLADFAPVALWSRWTTLILGDIVTALGVACFFRTYMPVQVFELFVAEVADRYRFSVNRVKWVFDLSLLALSFLLAVITGCYQGIGLGTLVTTVINAPIILFWGKLLDYFTVPTPLVPALGRILTTKGKEE
ncbi:MAG: hypothetical protein IKV74_06405 [Clostridia bacterium]|nr:hypothetical protein [Clostridia bacterium]